MRLGERISLEKFLDALFGDHHGRIVVRIIPVSAALTDKFGLTGPIVPGGECADRTFLRTVLRGDHDDQFALTPRFIASERDDLSPSRREDGPVEPGFSFRAIGQKMSLGIPATLQSPD